MSALMLISSEAMAAPVRIHRLGTARRRGHRVIEVPGVRTEVADEAPQIRFDNPPIAPSSRVRRTAFRAQDDPAHPPQQLVMTQPEPTHRHVYRLIADMRVSYILLTAVMTCAEAE
jgi:hypothetical protein